MYLQIKFKLHLLLFYPSTWYSFDFFLFQIEIEGKCGWIIGGAKGYVGPPPPPPCQITGGPGPPGPPPPTPMLLVQGVIAKSRILTDCQPTPTASGYIYNEVKEV